MSRKCISISYEFLEDLLGISRAGGKVTAMENNPAYNSLTIYFEDEEKLGDEQGMESLRVQSLRTYR